MILISLIGGVLIAFGVISFVYNNYKYPLCDKCGSNLGVKRIKGKIICPIHGKIG